MTPYYEDEAVTLYHGDCLDVMVALPTVEHVITDPPYESEAHTKGRRIHNPRTGELRMAPLTFDAMDATTRDRASSLMSGTRRWVLVFCQIEAAMVWRQAIEHSGGFRYMRTMVWVKPNGQPQLTGDRPGVGFESIVVAHSEAASRWNGGGSRGYLTHPVDANFSRTVRLHETQKPLPLMVELVALFTDEGDTILDPFAGSGTTGVAAKLNGRKAILIEREEKYCEVAAKRLAETQPGRLFDKVAKAKPQALPLGEQIA